MFIGSYIFEFVGVLFKWVVQYPFSLFTKMRIRSFKEIWDGTESLVSSNTLMYGSSNVFLGALIIALLIYFILWMKW
jgi:hypothetical protein